ncbi:MAG: conjugal transfer protein TraX [Defluviitaleaceae bacterium]|nr:conjugal transfer protein TraX [Defluviitaleaceae bacterium]
MSAFTLKLIAIAAMFIDHFAHVFEGRLLDDLVPAMRAAGRMAFPIFVYFIGEGFRRTGSVQWYLLRLGVFAIISEVPFDIMLYSHTYPEAFTWFSLRHQNVLFTLFLGVLAADFYQNTFSKKAYALLIPLPFVLAMFVQADFGLLGTMLVFLCAITESSKMLRLAFLFGGGVILYFAHDYSHMLIAGYVCALVLLMFYNEEQGPRIKWAFYAFYPLHMLALFGMLVIYEALV